MGRLPWLSNCKRGTMAGEPPFPNPRPDPAEQYRPSQFSTTRNGSINHIGDWLGRTFRAVLDHWVTVLILAFLLPAPFYVASYALVHRTLGSVRIPTDIDRLDQVEGFDAAQLGLAGVVLAVAVVVSVLGHLASVACLYEVHRGNASPGIGAALAVAASRFARFATVWLLYVAVVLVALSTPVGLFVYAVWARPSGALGLGATSVLLLLAAIVFLVWLWIKLWFLPVSAIAAPKGTSILSASWGISGGNRFWAVAARVGIAAGLAYVMGSLSQAVAQGLGGQVLFSGVEVLENDVLIGGRPIDALEVIMVSDVLPNPIIGVCYFGVLSLFSVVSNVVVSSAQAALYVDAGGPNAG